MSSPSPKCDVSTWSPPHNHTQKFSSQLRSRPFASHRPVPSSKEHWQNFPRKAGLRDSTTGAAPSAAMVFHPHAHLRPAAGSRITHCTRRLRRSLLKRPGIAPVPPERCGTVTHFSITKDQLFSFGGGDTYEPGWHRLGQESKLTPSQHSAPAPISKPEPVRFYKGLMSS